MIDPRWRTALAVAPYVVLAILVAFAVGAEWGDWSRLVPELALLAAMTAWIVVFRSLRLPLGGSRRRRSPCSSRAPSCSTCCSSCGRAGTGSSRSRPSRSPSRCPRGRGSCSRSAPRRSSPGMAQSSSLPRTTAIGLAGTIVVIVLNVTVMCGMSWGLQLASRLTERTGAEAERARLAREIHDTLAQGFAGIITQLQAAEQAPDDAARRAPHGRGDRARAGRPRGGATFRRRAPAARARRHAAARGDRRGRAALGGAHGIPVDVRLEGSIHRLRTDVEVALLRTTQEALANVERHAAASHVHVVLRGRRPQRAARGAGRRARLRSVGDGSGGPGRRVRARSPCANGSRRSRGGSTSSPGRAAARRSARRSPHDGASAGRRRPSRRP